MKVAVFGSTGMAGHVISRYLRLQGHDVIDITRADLDVERQDQVDQFLADLEAIDFAINCVGLLVKNSADTPDRAFMINGWWPHRLARHFQNRSTRVIHLSTDCVFDGSDGPYNELSPHTERNAYGRSKSAGELDNHKDITMRMSIIGPELNRHQGLLDWARYNPARELPGWSNALWNGITTLELAKCIDRYIQKPQVLGIYHLVNNSNRINKYELLLLINHVFDLGKLIVSTQGPKSINKILIDTRCEVDWGIPDYETQLRELREFYPIAHVSPASA